MFEYHSHPEFASHGWLKRSLSWLAVFAYVLDLLAERDVANQPDQTDIYFG